MEAYIPFLIFGIIISLFGIAVALSARYEKKRSEALRTAAENLGFSFLPTPSELMHERLRSMDLFQRGRGNKASNYLHRASDDVEVLIFDHQYTVSSGKNSHTHKQSVVAINSPQLNLPRFVISPEHFFHRIATAMGYQDIDFDQYPKFSKQFLLRGSDEQAIRDKLQNIDLERLAEFSGLCIEASADHFLVWFAGKRSKPDDLQTLFKQAFEIFVMLKD